MFRGKQSFSFRIAITASITVILCYILISSVFSSIVSKNNVATFGNYPYVLYSQVMGGPGWNQAVQDLGKSADSSTIYKIVFQQFLDHPISFFIATAKAYRDFFIPNHSGILSPLYKLTNFLWMNYILWLAGIGSLFWGLYKAWQNIDSPINSLMIASFIGIFLSIPFLPPIDGGSRVYTTTMPFFFLLMVSVIRSSPARKQNSSDAENNHIFKLVVNTLSIVLVFMTLIFPILVQKIIKADTILPFDCLKKEIPFAVKINPGSFIDLIPNETSSCGFLPNICLSDFETYGKEKNIDAFFQELLNTAKDYGSISRIFIGNNLIDNKEKFFMVNIDQINISAPSFITGCAIKGESRLLLLIQSTVT